MIIETDEGVKIEIDGKRVGIVGAESVLFMLPFKVDGTCLETVTPDFNPDDYIGLMVSAAYHGGRLEARAVRRYGKHWKWGADGAPTLTTTILAHEGIIKYWSSVAREKKDKSGQSNKETLLGTVPIGDKSI